MKNLIITLVSILLLSCQNDRIENYFHLEVITLNAPDQTKVYLYNLGERYPFDSTLVQNETFQFEGELIDPKEVIVFFEPNSKLPGHSVWLDPHEDIVLKYKIAPSKEWSFGLRKEHILQSDLNKIFVQFNEYKEKDKQLDYSHVINWCLKNPNNPIASKKTNELMNRVSKDTLELYINSIDKQTTRLATSQSILAYLNTTEFKGLNQKFLDFSAFDLEGNQHNLSEYNNKPIVLDFWASWCAPCHKKNKELLNPLFKKYGDKINFISYSIDTNKKAWKKSTKKDTYKWINLSNLKDWNEDPVAFNYEIASVPRLILIDKNGNVVFDDKENITNEMFEKKLSALIK